jgi:hypothetical protein
MRTIETDTPLIPYLIAERLTREPDKVRYLCERAERHYQQGRQFARRLRGARSREWLYAFMEHWLTALEMPGSPSREEYDARAALSEFRKL